MKRKSLEKLLVHELKDLHSAERQLLKAIPEMVDAATDPDLKAALETHLTETRNQGKRLTAILKALSYRPGGHKCTAMAGLIRECEEMCKAAADENVRDACLIACVQQIEHYEIAAYGTAIALAEKLGRQEAAATLRISLEEEEENHSDLADLSESMMRSQALVTSR